ncbi:invasion associated locus B family protein [Salinisphaera sp. Q1T1-3]|uniref:invasion associated locus B family protein n=1 Tax=Salinisphaera sp. Q1T1-3 TaxID=2321229 RepID=UPI000E733E76|nr:invasion associated locus B family protein [Salinisphaera sp. Q1T1-3]RJS95230.1 invasion associated locus B family protein [Salinisphaera sp. Q1T1-3]
MSKSFRLSAIALVAASFIGLTGTAAAQGQGANNAQDNVKISHYNDWEVRCPKSGGSKGDCEMTQLINSPSTGKPIMRVVMGYPPQIDSAAMIFILPLGTRLAPGVQLSVDGDQARRFPFQICLEQGCRADFPVNGSLLNKMKNGRSAQVTIVGPKGDQINLKISLSGFTDANNAIAS